MKTRILNSLIAVLLLLIPTLNYAQAPPLGTAADFVIFTTIGAVGNTGISHLTGNVGTNNGGVTGFGNVNGVMTYTSDPKSGLCATDLLTAYNQLNNTVPSYFPAPLLGNGDTLIAGIYSITGATTMNGNLYLNALGNPNAVFIFQIQGPLSTAASSKVILLNGAKACNVFWKIEGLVNMAPSTSMKGTVIANNAAINMSTGCTLEGRVLSTNGAVNVSGVLAYTPIGCGSPTLTGPIAPSLVSATCYTIFSSNGPVTNVGITNITGDVGTNVGLTIGFNPLSVTGAIHPIPDGSTAAAAADLLNAYSYLNTLPYDIELLYPAQFGNQLVLTPHTYLMNAAVTFTDTLFLDAMNDANAVFVIKIYGAINTSTYSKVKMINGTQSKNVYWMISGAVSINDYSEFVGTIVCNNGAMNLNTGVKLDGRALTTTGALNTATITAIMPPGCGLSSPLIITEPVNKIVCSGDSVRFSVTATGSSLTYQWRKGNVNLINGGHISGATSDTLKINPANSSDTASNYNVIVSGSLLPNDTSINVSLVVNTAPIITTEPINKTACVGSSISFSVTTSGTVLTYQWRKGNVNLTNGGNISGVNSNTLTINPINILDAATNYNVIITGSCLPNDTSVNASLVVNSPPIITTEPANKTTCIGNSVYFSVIATGSNLTYQWRKGTVNIINGGSISGATSDTLRFNPMLITDTASNYNVIVSGTCLPKDTSIFVSLLRGIAPIITTEPSNIIACAGNSVSFSVIATGTNLSYQWRKGTINLTNGGHILGATSNTLTINPLSVSDTASNYNVIVSGTCLPKDTSINVSLLIINANITSGPVNQTVCAGSSASFSVVAIGSGLTYQWRKGTVNLINGGNISGATSATLTINPANISDTASNYNVVVSGSCTSINSSSTAVDLKSAGRFGIIAGVGISSTGFSKINNMDVGISPGVRTSVTGFPPAALVNGAIYASDDIAPPGIAVMLTQAKQDLTDAYLFAEGATAPAPATVAGDQGGLTLAPGIYKSTSTLLLQSGDLTLDAQGNANAFWIFQIASNFTTVGGAGGNVILSGGAQAKNIIWQVGSSATIGNGTSFKGNILALTSITMNTGSSIDGRLLARNGAVVLSGTNIINSPSDTSINNSTVSSANVSLIVNSNNTIVLTSAVGTNNQTKCINTAITNITYLTTGATGASFSGLPAGVTGNWLANVVTISGTPTVSGTFNYTATLTGGCGTITAIGTITVSPNNTVVLSSAVGTNNQTKCINSAITNITYSTTGATGASFSGLPAGVTGNWLANVVTISGTPTASGTFNYTVTLSGGCGTITAIGTITVTPNNTIVLTSSVGSDNQTKCINTAITNITYSTTGATGASF
ncbi:MAG: DUF3494 domain-containing protein, partial [Bacteroidetes bacterium]|nr:DUF3494 domain-containing protein [Bacteroidota bacterium]